jgi:hypothetical protein
MSAALVIGSTNCTMANEFARQYAGYVRMGMPARASAAAQAFSDAAGVGAGQWVMPSGQPTTNQRKAIERWAKK